MSSHLNDVALIEDKYRIGASYRRQPVCDDERGTTAGEAAQRFHNSAFGEGIQPGGRLVEDDNGRIPQHGPRN